MRPIAALSPPDFQVEIEIRHGTAHDPFLSRNAADYVAAVARSALGPEKFVPVARPSMGGEDFSYYLQQVPGCFFLVGVYAMRPN